MWDSLLILKVRCLSSDWGNESLLDSQGGFLAVLISKEVHMGETRQKLVDLVIWWSHSTQGLGLQSRVSRHRALLSEPSALSGNSGQERLADRGKSDINTLVLNRREWCLEKRGLCR